MAKLLTLQHLGSKAACYTEQLEEEMAKSSAEVQMGILKTAMDRESLSAAPEVLLLMAGEPLLSYVSSSGRMKPFLLLHSLLLVASLVMNRTFSCTARCYFACAFLAIVHKLPKTSQM